MKNLLCVSFLFLIVNIPALSQTVEDTAKILSKVKQAKDERGYYNDSKKTKVRIPVSIKMQKDNFLIPLNLKIYQKILTNGIRSEHNFTSEELATGMLDDDLIAFTNNKKQSKKLFTEIYGNDLIDLRKILEILGITKDQITAVAAVLKFLLYHPYF